MNEVIPLTFMIIDKYPIILSNHKIAYVYIDEHLFVNQLNNLLL